MKIRSIKQTNTFKYIEFGQIKDCWRESAVLTPTGFSQIKAFSLIKANAPTKKLQLSNGMQLVCDPEHRLQLMSGESKFVKDLQISDRLVGYHYQGPVDFVISDGPLSDLYDIEIESPHWYFTSGIVSHNSIALCNSAISNALHGRNVLYITLELSDLLSAVRMLGVLTNKPIDERRFDAQSEMMSIVNKWRKSGELGDLVIHEFPPDEISVDNIYALIDNLKRTHSWVPDVVIIDYLELMISRRATDNKDDYLRQKSITTQVRGLSQNANVLVFTATQTNRGGNDVAVIELTKIAESYGKTMPVDYLISINQTNEERQDANGMPASIAPARLYIAKNRNGKNSVTVPVEINYATMRIKEIQ